MIILCHWAPACLSPSLTEVLPCESCKPQYGGLLSRKRIYEIKEEKEKGEGIEKLIQIDCGLGNTSKLINLVSLFNIWVWIIMQVRARTLILTRWMTLENMVPNII